MGLLDYIILIAYFGILVGIGWYTSKKQDSIEQYFVGGRQTGTFSLMTLWMSSWIGGASILGSAEQSFEIGVSSLWYPLAIAVGCVLFALTFTGRIKDAGDAFNHITYPDFIESRYDVRCRAISTVTAIFANVGYAASQLLCTATMTSLLTGWSLELSFVVATAVTVFYTSLGGFLAMDCTCRFQAILILLGVACVGLPLTVVAVGDIGRFSQELPPNFFSMGEVGGVSTFAMFLSVIMTFYTASDSYIRCFSAKTSRTARNGTLLAALLVVCIGISVCVMGLGARLLFPDLDNGTNAFITLVMRIFPTGVKGLMLVVLLSAIMSTASSCILTASANMTRDIYQRFINPTASERNIVILSMLSSLAVGAVGAFIAWNMQNIIALLCMAFTINSAGLFLPTLGAFFWKRATPTAAFWSMTMSLLTVLGWYFGKAAYPGNTVFAIDPVWPGLAVSFVLFGLISLLGKAPDTAVAEGKA